MSFWEGFWEGATDSGGGGWVEDAIDIFGQGVLGYLANNESNEAANEAAANVQSTLSTIHDRINNATNEAIGLIDQGEYRSAAAVMESNNEAIAQAWKGANLGVASLNRVMQKQSNLLQPYIKQGMFASDEMASMLGIRNSKGEVVPYDVEQLRNTPGYTFQFEEGLRAAENSRVGNYLSGASAKALVDYGQGMADQRFDKHFEQLGALATGGRQAATNLGSLYGSAGAAQAQIQGNAGINAARILADQGKTLANLHTGAAENRANLGTSAASTLSNIDLTGAIAQNNAAMTSATNTVNFLSDLAKMGGYSGTQTPYSTLPAVNTPAPTAARTTWNNPSMGGRRGGPDNWASPWEVSYDDPWYDGPGGY